jgi:hypothetical protein
MNQTPEQRAVELYKEADLQGIADLITDLEAVKRLYNENLEKLNIAEKQVEQLKHDKELFDKVILMGLVLHPDPLTGFKRLISRESIIEALKL